MHKPAHLLLLFPSFERAPVYLRLKVLSYL